MRSSSSPEEFFSKMNKKPHEQQLYDYCPNMSDEEIENFPNIKPWMKEAAKKVRDRCVLRGKMRNFEQVMDQYVTYFVNRENELKTSMEVRKFNTEWLGMPTGRMLGIDANENDIILLTNCDNNEYYFENTYGTLNFQNWNYMFHITECVGYATRPQYLEMLFKKHEKTYSNIGETVVPKTSTEYAGRNTFKNGLTESKDRLKEFGVKLQR